MILRWKLKTPPMKEVKKKKFTIRYWEPGLVQYCYGKQAFFQGFKTPEIWDWDFRQIRGLIYNDKRQLVARGLPKFFNAFEAPIKILSHPSYYRYRKILLEKFNGFMAIVFWHEGKLRFFTKGAGGHEFEQYAREMYEQGKLHGHDGKFEPGFSYIFECVHPVDAVNHVIKTAPGLYHLATIDVANDEMLVDTDKFPGEVIEVESWEQAFELQNKSTKEGYVCYLVEDDGRVKDAVKLKSPTYVAADKLKHEIEKGISTGDLYRNFFIDPTDHVKFNWQQIANVLGEKADDFSVHIESKVKQVEKIMDASYQVAKQRVEEHKTLPDGKKTLAIWLNENRPYMLGLTMAIWVGRRDQVTKVLNYSLLDFFMNEMDKANKTEASNTPTVNG